MMLHVPLCGVVHTNVSCWSMTLGHAYMMLCVLLCGHVHMMLHVPLYGLVHTNVLCWFHDGWDMCDEHDHGACPHDALCPFVWACSHDALCPFVWACRNKCFMLVPLWLGHVGWAWPWGMPTWCFVPFCVGLSTWCFISLCVGLFTQMFHVGSWMGGKC